MSCDPHIARWCGRGGGANWLRKRSQMYDIDTTDEDGRLLCHGVGIWEISQRKRYGVVRNGWVLL